MSPVLASLVGAGVYIGSGVILLIVIVLLLVWFMRRA